MADEDAAVADVIAELLVAALEREGRRASRGRVDARGGRYRFWPVATWGSPELQKRPPNRSARDRVDHVGLWDAARIKVRSREVRGPSDFERIFAE